MQYQDFQGRMFGIGRFFNGGEISEAVKKIKKEKGVIVISLNMPGSVTEHADLIITDPVQAGVLAVMAIADTAVFDIKKLHGNIKY